MPKADLTRRIDQRPTSAFGVGRDVVTPSTIGGNPGDVVIIIQDAAYVGRREGPHVGLFRLGDGRIFLDAVDTANVPFFSVGSIDYDVNRTWLNIGYPNQPGIRLPAATADFDDPEQHRGLEVDAETLVGMLPPDVLPLAVINSSMIDWGLVGLQVSAADVPIEDAGGYYDGTDVEAALQEIGGYLPQIGLCCDAANVNITDAGGYFASTEVEAALQELASWRGSKRTRVVANTTNALLTDDLIVCDSAAAMAVYLPGAGGTGHDLIVKSIGAGSVTVDGDGDETIDGQAEVVLGQWDALSLVDYTPGAWAIV